MKWKLLTVVSYFLQLYGLYSRWSSPGQNTGVGSRSLLQGIFPTQGLNLGLPHCRWILYQLCHKGSPRILEWVAYPFSSRSSQPRNPTVVSCIAGGFFTNWAIKEISLLPWELRTYSNDSVAVSNAFEVSCLFLDTTYRIYKIISLITVQWRLIWSLVILPIL